MKYAIILSVLTILISCSSNDNKKYRFRGEDRKGIYQESELLKSWPLEGFDSYMGGIVKFGNYLYAGATRKNELCSINATTGVLTDSLKIGSGALIAADNMLYYNQKGTYTSDFHRRKNEGNKFF